MDGQALPLMHGRVYALHLEDGTLLPLLDWRETLGMPWQLLDTCPGGDLLCTHGRHPDLIVLPDGRFEVDDGVEASRHDLDVRAMVEGLTVDHLRPANRLAIFQFRAVAG
jgi:hypothetical protein